MCGKATTARCTQVDSRWLSPRTCLVLAIVVEAVWLSVLAWMAFR